MHAVAAASRLTSCLYHGLVTHQRLGRKTQRFRYPVTSWLIDLDEIPALERRLRLFSHNRFNLLSLRDRDLGAGDGGSPKQWMVAQLARHGLDLAGGRILIHAFPRVLGIGFSPLTTWFCYQACGRLAAVQYEVHNTFGERHSYLALLGDRPLPRTLRHRTDKLFHVSPFLDLSGSYRMALRAPDETYSLVIQGTSQDGAAETTLLASHIARRQPLTDGALLGSLLALLALPLIVIGGIHWQALKLFFKRARFYRKPAPPEMISLVRHSGDVS
jgi:DUF1365 family protein